MNAVEILQNHQVKKTSARVAIVQALQESSYPLSENEIKFQMGELYDRITFFRNTQTLMESGIIHRIVVNNTNIKYALNRCEENHQHQTDHVHFFCQHCNSLVCLMETKTQAYPLPNGYSAEQCEVIIKGLCGNCSQTKAL
jgi:Fur family ferric uptake transcriptional regulator